MCRIALSIPNEVLFDTKMSDNDTMDFARKSVAISYYTQKGVSLGYCAEIAGMSKEQFVHFLSANKISIFNFDSQEEFLEDVANA